MNTFYDDVYKSLAFNEKRRFAKTDPAFQTALHKLNYKYRKGLVAALETEDVFSRLSKKQLPTAFVRHYEALADEPYILSCNDILLADATTFATIRFRDALCQFTKKHVQEPAPRIVFSLWLIWKHNDFDKAIYADRELINEHLKRTDYTFDQVLTKLYEHPFKPGQFTYEVLHRRQLSFVRMLQRASVLVDMGSIADDWFDSLSTEQMSAVTNIVSNGWSVLRGGAGSGKSFTISKLFFAVKTDKFIRPICLVPTHKAAKVLAEKQVDVRTIYSFAAELIMSKGERSREPNDDNRETKDTRPLFIIIDESSMIPLSVLADLARGLSNRGQPYQLVFVGDPNQLEPIGRGEVYRHLIERYPSRVNMLVTNRRGEFEDLIAAGNTIADEGVIPGSSDTYQLVPSVSEDVIKSLLSPVDKLPVFIAYTKATVGSKNRLVQNEMHDKGVTSDVAINFKTARNASPHYLRINDPVVWNGENEHPLTKGTCGRVIEGNGNTCLISWDDDFCTLFSVTKEVCYDLLKKSKALHVDAFGDAVQLAYCLTAHKAQGSEWSHVVVVMAYGDVDSVHKHSDRRWLYTALTRAKRSVKLLVPPGEATRRLREAIEAPIRPMKDMVLEGCDRGW